nr:hypothetical protein [Extibacter muris]
MVTGIISIVLFALISFQSCAAGLSNALEQNNATSGTAGLLLAFIYLIAGIIACAFGIVYAAAAVRTKKNNN